MESTIIEPNYIVDYDDALGIDMDQAAADVAVFTFPAPVVVLCAGATVTEVCAGSTSTPVVKFDKRPTAGSDTDRGDGDIGHLLLLTAAAGTVMIDKVGRGTTIAAGEEVVVQLVTAAVGTPTGHIRPFMQVRPVQDLIENSTDVSETTDPA